LNPWWITGYGSLKSDALTTTPTPAESGGKENEEMKIEDLCKTVKGMRETLSHIRQLAEDCTKNNDDGSYGMDGYGKIMEWCDLHKD